MLPGLATIQAWDGCDHVGPAYEGDLIEFRHRLAESAPAGSGRLLRFETIGTIGRSRTVHRAPTSSGGPRSSWAP